MHPARVLRAVLRRLRRPVDRRLHPAPPAPSAAERGAAAYAERRWRTAERALDRALRSGGDRRSWLLAASTQEKLRDPDLRDAYARVGDRLFPSPHYDSAAAFAVATSRPHERDEVGAFLAVHADEIAAAAEERVAAARPAPEHAFVYWDAAERPDVVEHCVAAMRRWLPADLPLVELSAATIGDWIDLDPRIMNRVDIPAHAADVIRLHLLSRHPGLWLDASCLLNPGFAEFAAPVRQQDFFVFTYAGSRTGNWFIRGRPDSYRLQAIRSAMDAWFLDGRGWTNYFQFHDVVEMLFWTDERYRREWEAGLAIHPGAFFDLHRALGVPVSDAEWAEVRSAQPVNKLSWRKYNAPELRQDPATGIARLMAEPL